MEREQKAENSLWAWKDVTIQVEREGRELGLGEDNTRGSWRSFLGSFTPTFKKRTRCWEGRMKDNRKTHGFFQS